MKQLHVAIAAGGTAGHINPALALAHELVLRGHTVEFYGQAHKMEGDVVPKAGFAFFPIRVSGFDRKRPWTAISALWRMRKAQKRIGRHFKEGGRPEVAIGFGAYVELPLLEACRRAQIPYLIHEQNSVPGLANKLCADHATTIALGFDAAKPRLAEHTHAPAHFVTTGNPVRAEIGAVSKKEARRALGIAPDARVLLVFGGSLGARSLNDVVCENVHELISRVPGLYVIHATGKDDFERVQTRMQGEDHYVCYPYLEQMELYLAAADCVLSRAGASTIAELLQSERPALLVPYPLATENHQEVNAKSLCDLGVAHVVRDEELGRGEWMIWIERVLTDEVYATSLQEAYKANASVNAAQALAHEVEAVV